MSAGVIDNPFGQSHKVDTKLAPGYGKQRQPRRKSSPVTVPAPHPIAVGDTVIARDYMSGGEYRKQFTGTAVVKVINIENRKSFRTGKSYESKRLTVITSDGKRYDILEGMLQYVGTFPVVAPVAKPSPLPERVEVVDVAPLLLPAGVISARDRRRNQRLMKAVNFETPAVIELPANSAEIAGYLPACIEMNFRTVAMVQRQGTRREYEQETGEKLPEWKPLDLGQKWEWKNVPGKGWTKVKVS